MPPRGPKGQLVGQVPPKAGKPRQPARSKQAGAKGSTLMVRNLPLDVKPEDVTELFTETTGPLSSAPEMFCDAKGEFNGTALVHFRDGDSAAKAWEQLNEKLVDNMTRLYLYLVYPNPPAHLLSNPPASATGAAVSSLGNLAPFPGQTRKAPAAKKPTPLAQRLGPVPVPLASRLGKVVSEGAVAPAGGAGGAKKTARANLKKAAPGAGRKKRSGAAKAAGRMDVD